MSYGLDGLGYELWPECFGICAMAWMLWGMSDGLNALGMSDGLNALGYELRPECFRGMSYGLDSFGYEL